ncbi:MAG: type II toxin-antitoxin system prevent-host-death family antitoxin [Verrucomicrobiales bacterium]|nr:type II toxin-antitoxin system prevent-host-death family antitoxin [Verrucomicrobiales bacterium]
MPETVTTHEAKTHLSRLLAEVEQGKSFTIARGKKPVAVLSPVAKAPTERPKVGDLLGEPDPVPESALLPVSDVELENEWGL